MSETQTTEQAAKALQMIAADMADDAVAFDGKPFTGRSVAEYMANQGAAIAALAKIMHSMLPAIEAAKVGLAALPMLSDDPDPETACCGHFLSSHYPTGCWAGKCPCLLSEAEARAAATS